ncbi:MAG: PD40 domain-containing protein [Cyclobacteriaceae bacterium]|nr:PD40 domain-containing protein [Cyclobacteriaceae bacterium]
MKVPVLLILLLLHLVTAGYGQAKMRKMATNLNHPAINNYAPYISLDGNSLVYVADLGEDHALTMAYSTRDGVNWKDPVMLPRVVNNRSNFLMGFGLSPDGKTLYIANQKSNGMGGYDIYASQLRGSTWQEPVNMLLPVNSKGHEASPSVSLDGSSFYYMRCDKMNYEKAEGCRLLVMKKKPNGQWDTPEELPDYINTGNSQAPRIMGDGETLIFASDKILPNRGGMDLYLTRLVDGQWSRPVSLDFVNSPKDDHFVSATAAGLYLLKEAQGQRSSELVELLFPPEVRPKGTLRVDGTLTGPPDLTSVYVTVFNRDSRQKSFVTRPGSNGQFVAYLKYGSRYDLSIESAEDHYTFFNRVFDLSGPDNSMVEQVHAVLEPAASDAVLDVDGIEFEPGTANLSPASGPEISRLARMIRGNSQKSFAIEVTLYGLVEDSLRSSPDLTETSYDTTRLQITYALDSVTTATRDTLVVKPRYHNDRTLAQAKAIISALQKEGIPPGQLAGSGTALKEAVIEKRRTEVQVIVH